MDPFQLVSYSTVALLFWSAFFFYILFFLMFWLCFIPTLISPIKPKEHLADMFADVKVNKKDFGEHFWPKLELSEKLNNNLNKNMAYYLGGLYSMDYNVGRLLDTIDQLGLRDNTIIAFTADHGAATMGRGSSTSQNMLGYCGGLRDYKHSYYEGGVRIPFLVRWPGMIPAGRQENSPMSFLDWLPTVCSLAGVPYKQSDVEGENFADVWLGGGSRNRMAPLFWNKEGGGDYAMLSKGGDWKLHFNTDNRWELYNLKNDIEETKNLVSFRFALRQVYVFIFRLSEARFVLIF